MGNLSKDGQNSAILNGSSVISPKKFYRIYFHCFLW